MLAVPTRVRLDGPVPANWAYFGQRMGIDEFLDLAGRRCSERLSRHRGPEVSREERVLTKRHYEEEMAYLAQPLFPSEVRSMTDRRLNARLNIREEDWDSYAQGYKEAADQLVTRMGESPISHDFLVYPIVFLYRHYLELRLKELLVAEAGSWELLDSEIRKLHKLIPIWNEVRPNLEAVWSDSVTGSQFDAIEDRLKEIASIDSASFAFRYPVDTKGRPSLAGIQHVNLDQVRNVVQAMSNVLDGASIGLAEYLQAKAEMISEYQAQAADNHVEPDGSYDPW